MLRILLDLSSIRYNICPISMYLQQNYIIIICKIFSLLQQWKVHRKTTKSIERYRGIFICKGHIEKHRIPQLLLVKNTISSVVNALLSAADYFLVGTCNRIEKFIGGFYRSYSYSPQYQNFRCYEALLHVVGDHNQVKLLQQHPKVNRQLDLALVSIDKAL